MMTGCCSPLFFGRIVFIVVEWLNPSAHADLVVLVFDFKFCFVGRIRFLPISRMLACHTVQFWRQPA